MELPPGELHLVAQTIPLHPNKAAHRDSLRGVVGAAPGKGLTPVLESPCVTQKKSSEGISRGALRIRGD